MTVEGLILDVTHLDWGVLVSPDSALGHVLAGLGEEVSAFANAVTEEEPVRKFNNFV